MDTRTLFERLGRSSGIERIVDEVASRHLENPIIAARFRPYLEQPDKLQALKTHLARFLEMGSGGPQRYGGPRHEDHPRGHEHQSRRVHGRNG
jgi:hemoglobin